MLCPIWGFGAALLEVSLRFIPAGPLACSRCGFTPSAAELAGAAASDAMRLPPGLGLSVIEAPGGLLRYVPARMGETGDTSAAEVPAAVGAEGHGAEEAQREYLKGFFNRGAYACPAGCGVPAGQSWVAVRRPRAPWNSRRSRSSSQGTMSMCQGTPAPTATPRAWPF